MCVFVCVRVCFELDDGLVSRARTQVIKEKRLKEVANAFNLPVTCTSGSFTLRKIYIKLLHDFEQVYFFGTRGKPVPPPSPAVGGTRKADMDMSELSGGGLGSSAAATQTTRRSVPPDVRGIVGSMVSGEVVSCIDVGYVVTVNVDGQRYKGIMYEPVSASAKHKQAMGLAHRSTVGDDSIKVSKRIMKRRRAKLLRSQGVPKQNKTAFNYFSSDVRPQARIACGPDVPESDVSKKIGEMWAACQPEQKAPYLAQADEDRQRYNSELAVYYEKLREKALAEEEAGEPAQKFTDAGVLGDIDKFGENVDTTNNTAVVAAVAAAAAAADAAAAAADAGQQQQM